MNLISTREDLLQNLNTIESYLASGDSSKVKYAKELVKKGKCFVVYTKDGITRFAPSRFIGYLNNNMGVHEDNNYRHGGVTNNKITSILKQKLQPNADLDKDYINYCNYLGTIPGKSRKSYWN